MNEAPITPSTPTKPPVEWKVKAASLGTFLASVAGLAVLQAVDADHSLIEFLPDPLEAISFALIPTGIAWLAGFKARHTARPDLPLDQR
ncbi:hypothetical protein [Sphaerisporangium sp. TRM90804]|uniref:hypothetical protein n=1 Tax=Sphaerisporangium sp. TRM90804 TaxID=3031113 RepID=UPI00244AB5FE|nr:hypothetical protein [Sphaerisporangium sp. TRM90804]MDH2429303.1 hypothetical protein [Sphaerisporangium sp. TRM90804]